MSQKAFIQQPLTECLAVPRTGCTVVAGWVSPLALEAHGEEGETDWKHISASVLKG